MTTVNASRKCNPNPSLDALYYPGVTLRELINIHEKRIEDIELISIDTNNDMITAIDAKNERHILHMKSSGFYVEDNPPTHNMQTCDAQFD